VQEVVRVLEFGRKKYAAENWRKVPDLRRRYFAAMMRHVAARLRGEIVAKDSGLNHWAHAACSALFLLEVDLGGVPPDFGDLKEAGWPTDPSSR
jgi:hypothetical protein